MAIQKTYGLKLIKSGVPKADGTFPTQGMVELCRTYKNSCEFTEDDPQVTSEYSDQQDDPIHTFVEKGAKTIKFSTFDYSAGTLVKLKGGTVLNEEWSESVRAVEIFQAVELVTDSGFSIKFPKCRISAKFNAKLVKNGLSLLEVTISPLSPAAGKPSVIIG